MKNKNKIIDPLPDSFATEEEAGAFWDSHSTMDYLDHLEPVGDVIEIRKRVFEVPVEEDLFQRLQQEARALHQSIPKVVDHILTEILDKTQFRYVYKALCSATFRTSTSCLRPS